jgi:hypothetical protein
MVLENYKYQVHLRQETFNGHLQFFWVLSNTSRHGFDNHKHDFEAICMIV